MVEKKERRKEMIEKLADKGGGKAERKNIQMGIRALREIKTPINPILNC